MVYVLLAFFVFYVILAVLNKKKIPKIEQRNRDVSFQNINIHMSFVHMLKNSVHETKPLISSSKEILF